MIASASPRRILAAALLTGAATFAAVAEQPAVASTSGAAAADTACVSQPFNPKDPTAPLIRCCPPDSQCTQFPPRIDLPPTTTTTTTTTTRSAL